MNHTTNSYRLRPQGSDTASSQSTVRFDLPNNTLLDLKEVKFLFNAKTTGGVANRLARLPNKISSLIERVSVSIGGVEVYSSHSAYNEVAHIKQILECGKTKANNRIMSHDFIVPAVSPVDGTTLSTNEAPSSANQETQFCIGGGDLLGFFEGMPRVFDTALVGSIVLEMTFAPSTILVQCNTTALTDAPTGAASTLDYTVNNMRLLVTAYGVMDGVYDASVDNQMQSSPSGIEFAFKQYYTFFDTFTGSSRFSLSGVQCLDKLYAGFHVDGYNAQAPAFKVSGYDSGVGAVTLPEFVGDKYQSKYFKYTQPSGLTGLQWQLNGQFYPTFSATPDECWSLTAEAVENYGHGSEVTSLKNYKDNYFIFAKRFNHPESSSRLLSGMDFSSVNLAGFLNGTGSANVPVIIVAETTATLRIKEQLQIAKIN